MYKTMKKRQVSHTLWFTFIGVILAYLLFINLKTPMMGEDYAFVDYSISKTKLVKNIFFGVIDKFNPDNKSFNMRLGETFTFLILNLGRLLGIGKVLFSIINPFITLFFFTLIFYWCNCRFPDFNSIKDLVIFLTIPVLFLICSYSIGEIFFWFEGATNYLWSGTILLGISIPYRKYLNNEEYKMKSPYIPIYMIISYIAAFTNENTVPIIILLGGFLLLRDFIKNGIKKIPVWLLLSTLSMGIGYSVLIFSPNTKRRTAVYRDMYSLPEKMSIDEIKNNASRVKYLFFASNDRLLIIFILCIITFFFFLICKKKKVITGYKDNQLLLENSFLFLISLISIIALFFAPYTEIRTFLFVQIFIIMLILQFNYIILSVFQKGILKYIKFLPNISLYFLSLLFLFRLSFWTLDYAKFNKNKSESIKKQLAVGKTSVEAQMYPFEENRYLNTREAWIRNEKHGGAWYYARFYGAEKVLWKSFSYEESMAEKKLIGNIPIPRDVSDILTHDIISKEILNDILVIHCGINDSQVYFLLEDPLRNSLGDYFIGIEYTNSKSGLLQIFYDFYGGFQLSEKNSVRIDIERTSETTKIVLPLIGDWEYLYSIRVDPPDGTIFEIVNISILEKDE